MRVAIGGAIGGGNAVGIAAIRIDTRVSDSDIFLRRRLYPTRGIGRRINSYGGWMTLIRCRAWKGGIRLVVIRGGLIV